MTAGPCTQLCAKRSAFLLRAVLYTQLLTPSLYTQLRCTQLRGGSLWVWLRVWLCAWLEEALRERLAVRATPCPPLGEARSTVSQVGVHL